MALSEKQMREPNFWHHYRMSEAAVRAALVPLGIQATEALTEKEANQAAAVVEALTALKLRVQKRMAREEKANA